MYASAKPTPPAQPISRIAADAARKRLAGFPILTITGPSQSGKTTLCRRQLKPVTGLAAWQRIDTFDGRSSLSTWLIGIMKFNVIGHFPKSKRTPVATFFEA